MAAAPGRRTVRHAIRLFVSLYILWLLLSGHWKDPLLLSLGLLSAALTVFVAWRMERLDHEESPIKISLRALPYIPWLAWQILLSNLAVAKVILAPGRATPHLDWVPATQTTTVGRVIFANSITLTPGTIAVQIDNQRILVHALETACLDDLTEGTMDRRVTGLERPLLRGTPREEGES